MRSLLLACIIISLAVVVFSGCKKEGLGGKGEIKGFSVAGGKTVKPATFYIKYGAKTSPGSDVSKYDANSLADSDGKFDFKELNKGDYFIYVTATDNGLPVSGGMYVELGKAEMKDNVAIAVNP